VDTIVQDWRYMMVVLENIIYKITIKEFIKCYIVLPSFDLKNYEEERRKYDKAMSE